MTFLHHDATRAGWKFLHFYIFTIWTAYIALDPLLRLQHLSESLYRPTGLFLKFLPREYVGFFLQQEFLLVFKGFLLLFLVLTLFHKAVRLSSFMVCLMLTLYQTFIRCFGTMNHAELNLLYAAYILTLFCWCFSKADREGVSSTKYKINIYSLPYVFILLTMCLTYSLTGIHRLMDGGLEIYMVRSLEFSMVDSAQSARLVNWNLDVWIMSQPWARMILLGGFPVGTVFEILAPFCLISKRFRILFILVMIPFHFLIWFAMEILFLEQLLLFMLFFDISRRLVPYTYKKPEVLTTVN